MCTICKKFKKGTVDVDEAKGLLDEMMDYLSEEHIEEIEQMIFEAEDTYDYMTQRRLEQAELDGDDDTTEDYAPEEDLHEIDYDEDDDD